MQPLASWGKKIFFFFWETRLVAWGKKVQTKYIYIFFNSLKLIEREKLKYNWKYQRIPINEWYIIPKRKILKLFEVTNIGSKNSLSERFMSLNLFRFLFLISKKILLRNRKYFICTYVMYTKYSKNKIINHYMKESVSIKIDKRIRIICAYDSGPLE